MDKLKRVFDKHFELFAILVIVGVMVLIDRFTVQKITFLNFYYIPVLLAGYTQGKRIAGLTALLCIAAVLVCLLYDSSGTDATLKGFSLGAGPLVEDTPVVAPELPVEPKSPILMQKAVRDEAKAKAGEPDAKETPAKPGEEKKTEAKTPPVKPAEPSKKGAKEAAAKPGEQGAKDAKPKLDDKEKQVVKEKKDKARERTMFREALEGQTEERVYHQWIRKLRWSVYTHIAAWGGFLFLSGVMVGALSEEMTRRHSELRMAYVGICWIVSNYLEVADKYMKGHIMRVSEMATEIAEKLELSPKEVECVHSAALLHEMAKLGLDVDLIQRAAVLSVRETEKLGAEERSNTALLAKVGSMLGEAVPMIVATESLHKKEMGGENAPMGAQVIDLVDSFDALAGEGGKPPKDVLEQIKKDKPRYDEKLLAAAEQVLLAAKRPPDKEK